MSYSILADSRNNILTCETIALQLYTHKFYAKIEKFDEKSKKKV